MIKSIHKNTISRDEISQKLNKTRLFRLNPVRAEAALLQGNKSLKILVRNPHSLFIALLWKEYLKQGPQEVIQYEDPVIASLSLSPL